MPALEKRFQDSRALLQELVRRGWLTGYQAQQLAQGKGGELMLGPYRLLDRLGEGAAGQVFKAVHEKQGYLVALKVLRKDLQGDAEASGRFRREIEAISQVAHPNIVKAYEAGTASGHLFLAMEYVQGIDLDRLVKQSGPLPPATACTFIRQAALALQHAHERGLVHRDIKPANLLLASKQRPEGSTDLPPRLADGEVKLLDLGLARLLQPKADSTTNNLTMLAGNSVTMGTPDYLAPEQAIDLRSADIRADIYSLGCTFFYLLTGRPPFAGGSLTEKLMRHHQAEPPAAASLRPETPAALEPILQRMLAKKPADRYQTPGEVASALAKIDLKSPGRPRRLLPRAVLVGLFLLLPVLGWWFFAAGNAALTTGPAASPLAMTPPTTPSTPLPPPTAAAGARTIAIQGKPQVRDALIDFSKADTPLGGVPRDNQLIKNVESTAFLVRFPLERLPATTQVDQAILSFFVWDPHNNATSKVEAFPLKTPWQEGQATWRQPMAGQSWKGGAGFARAQDAGPALGHAVVRPDQGGDTADPPIEYQIDVTAIVRAWVRGAAPNEGFAIISVPDRAIDKGNQSRFQIFASEHNRPEHTPKLTLRVHP